MVMDLCLSMSVCGRLFICCGLGALILCLLMYFGHTAVLVLVVLWLSLVPGVGSHLSYQCGMGSSLVWFSG